MSSSARPLIVARLQAAGLPFKALRGTSNIRAVLRQSWSSPACFVWRANRRRTGGTGCMVQVETIYHVLIIVSTDKDDGTVEDSAEALSDGVFQALHDWAPVTDGPTLSYQDGSALTDLERNRLFWDDTYLLKQTMVKL